MTRLELTPVDTHLLLCLSSERRVVDCRAFDYRVDGYYAVRVRVAYLHCDDSSLRRTLHHGRMACVGDLPKVRHRCECVFKRSHTIFVRRRDENSPHNSSSEVRLPPAWLELVSFDS